MGKNWMGKNWIRIPLTTIELFKGKIDKLWRIASKNLGPKRIPGVISRILDIFLRPKT